MKLIDFIIALVIVALIVCSMKIRQEPVSKVKDYKTVDNSDYRLRKLNGVYVGDYYHSFDYSDTMPVKQEK